MPIFASAIAVRLRNRSAKQDVFRKSDGTNAEFQMTTAQFLAVPSVALAKDGFWVSCLKYPIPRLLINFSFPSSWFHGFRIKGFGLTDRDGPARLHTRRRRDFREGGRSRVPPFLPGPHSGITVAMCSSLSCFAVTEVGLCAMRSWPFCVLGNAMTSRMLVVPQSNAVMRSRPKAMPPCGGAP
jgi:hypothetical protein